MLSPCTGEERGDLGIPGAVETPGIHRELRARWVWRRPGLAKGILWGSAEPVPGSCVRSPGILWCKDAVLQ